MKETMHLISSPLSHMFNQSFVKGSVPLQMKIAKIIPIFKNSLNNYRPISLLPAFSKLLEKIVAQQLVKFLDKYNIIYEHQYGFRKKHSTIHPILHLLNYIADSSDKPSKDITLGLFLDLSKSRFPLRRKRSRKRPRNKTNTASTRLLRFHGSFFSARFCSCI